jgi:hypothetical protein
MGWESLADELSNWHKPILVNDEYFVPLKVFNVAILHQDADILVVALPNMEDRFAHNCGVNLERKHAPKWNMGKMENAV